jgi:type I restriction enzyme M protein
VASARSPCRSPRPSAATSPACAAPATSSWSARSARATSSAGQTEAEAQRPRRKDLKPATGDNLLFAFRRCHNYIAGTEGKQKAEAFWELLKLIFCKIEDEGSRSLDFYVTATERANTTAAAAAKARITKLFADKVVAKYRTIFPASDATIDLKPNVVAFVISQLQGYSLLASPVDVKGVAYEEIVGSNLRGDRGEFFTPAMPAAWPSPCSIHNPAKGCSTPPVAPADS